MEYCSTFCTNTKYSFLNSVSWLVLFPDPTLSYNSFPPSLPSFSGPSLPYFPLLHSHPPPPFPPLMRRNSLVEFFGLGRDLLKLFFKNLFHHSQEDQHTLPTVTPFRLGIWLIPFLMVCIFSNTPPFPLLSSPPFLSAFPLLLPSPSLLPSLPSLLSFPPSLPSFPSFPPLLPSSPSLLRNVYISHFKL